MRVVTSVRILRCSNFRLLESNFEMFECFETGFEYWYVSCLIFLLVMVLFVLKMLVVENENTPTKHFVKNAKHLNIWRKEKATKM